MMVPYVLPFLNAQSSIPIIPEVICTTCKSCLFIAALKKQEAGIAVKDIVRELGVSDATFYNWKAKYGGMEASDVAKMKELEKGNAELKKMFAELSIETRAMKNLIEKKL
jgi:putative transposase